jgi:O-antigen/teichoic acid export membrane protein
VKSIAPSITNAKKHSYELYEKRLQNLYRMMFVIFLITFSFVLLIGKEVVLFLYGQEYFIAANLFILASFRTLYTNFGVASGQFITNENLFKYSMLFTILGALMNICLNYLLIPLYQAKGALIATIISFTFSIFIVYLLFKRTRKNGILMLKGIITFYKLNLKGI